MGDFASLLTSKSRRRGSFLRQGDKDMVYEGQSKLRDCGMVP